MWQTPHAWIPTTASPGPETVSLEDVEKAFEKMHHGEVLRSVVEL